MHGGGDFGKSFPPAPFFSVKTLYKAVTLNQETFTDVMRRLRLVLVRTRFPENVGTAARASANFGHAPLYLVTPER